MLESWIFVIVTYLTYGQGAWSYGIVPSKEYTSHVECEIARGQFVPPTVINGWVKTYPCTTQVYAKSNP